MLLLCSMKLSAQERKWHFEADLRYQHMMVWHEKGNSDMHLYNMSTTSFNDYQGKLNEWIVPGDYSYPDKSGGMSLLLMETYRLSPRWTVGLGAGFSRYNQLDFNTVPIFALGRWHPWMQHQHAYLYAEAGFLGCPALNLGYGVSLKLSKHRRLALKLGYDFQPRRHKTDFEGTVISDGPDNGQPQWYKAKWTDYMHCLQGSIGIVF